MILLALALALAAAHPAYAPPQPERNALAYLICNYIDSPACAALSEEVTVPQWRALLRSFPEGRLRSLLVARRGEPSTLDYITDRDLAWLEADADRAEFHRLFCDDTLFAEIADDRGGLSSEQVMEERAQICQPENTP